MKKLMFARQSWFVLAAVFLFIASVIATTTFAYPYQYDDDDPRNGVEIWGNSERQSEREIQEFFDAAQAALDAMLVSYVESQMQTVAQQLELPFERDQPVCLQEQLIMQGLQAAIASPSVQSGAESPPGRLIIPYASIGDPQFQGDPGWDKWQLVARWGPQGQPPPYTVVIHYMFNSVTKQATQFKFKNSPEQGCRS